MNGMLLWSFLQESLIDATSVPGMQVNGSIAAIPDMPLDASAIDDPVAIGGSPS